MVAYYGDLRCVITVSSESDLGGELAVAGISSNHGGQIQRPRQADLADAAGRSSGRGGQMQQPWWADLAASAGRSNRCGGQIQQPRLLTNDHGKLNSPWFGPGMMGNYNYNSKIILSNKNVLFLTVPTQCDNSKRFSLLETKLSQEEKFYCCFSVSKTVNYCP